MTVLQTTSRNREPLDPSKHEINLKTGYRNSILAFRKILCDSAREPNRLMLFGETVAVYCENHTEHTDTVHTSQETHYVSATETNRLILFEETVAVYWRERIFGGKG
jgi:hypothetical protein